MSNGVISDQRRRAARKHAARVHTCNCGRRLHGNGYKNHFKVCAVRAAWLAFDPSI